MNRNPNPIHTLIPPEVTSDSRVTHHGECREVSFEKKMTVVSSDSCSHAEVLPPNEPKGGRVTKAQSLFAINTAVSGNIADELNASNKSRSICCVRALVALTLVTAAIIVASLTFSLNRSAELKQFEREYFDSVVKVEEAIANGIRNKVNAAKTFSAIYTSHFSADNNWPNVTMPSQDFNAQAAGQLEVANGIAISYNPIITTKNRNEFEAHALDSASILGDERLVTRSCDDESGATCRIVADGIYRKGLNPSGEGLINIDDPGFSEGSRFPNTMIPVWQIYPTQNNWRAILFNLHSETKRQHALDDMMEYEVPTITSLLHLVQHDEMNPSSILFYPVFDRFESSLKDNSPFFGEDSREIVGSVSIVFTWAQILHKVLPNYIEGMHIVLESSDLEGPELQLQQQWTYDVSGEEVTLLGEGDVHEPKFDKFEHKVEASGANETENLGIVGNLVSYEIRIYPSSVFRKRYLSQKPLAMTIVVVSIFILTSLIFFAYDYLVHYRQNAIMNFASKAGHIVDNLFPSSVRERLFRHVDQINEPTNDEEEGPSLQMDSKSESDGSRRLNTLKEIRGFLKGRRGNDSNQRPVSEYSDSNLSLDNYTDINTTNPIVDRFDDTSIMFSDIVGFTKWSSDHSPEEVFRLIENLFYEFDKIAARMNVLKLDRVGDCYIACTGLPHETKDHGVIICQFAEECRAKMFDVLERLGHHLDGVEGLSMRFGIHSGPVTAGVLRGQKSRFELFGDTMNYASRMESLCIPGLIQISQDTASLLITAGHNNWITPRAELVYAKGKGEVQTYWLSTKGKGPCSMLGRHIASCPKINDTEHI